MTPDEFKARTRRFGGSGNPLRSESAAYAADVIGRQLIRAATSVGANYRAACGARSQPEFLAKLGIVEEEADESIYWMEVLVEAELADPKDLAPLLQEANKLVSMVVASIRTSRAAR